MSRMFSNKNAPPPYSEEEEAEAAQFSPFADSDYSNADWIGAVLPTYEESMSQPPPYASLNCSQGHQGSNWSPQWSDGPSGPAIQHSNEAGQTGSTSQSTLTCCNLHYRRGGREMADDLFHTDPASPGTDNAMPQQQRGRMDARALLHPNSPLSSLSHGSILGSPYTVQGHSKCCRTRNDLKWLGYCFPCGPHCPCLGQESEAECTCTKDEEYWVVPQDRYNRSPSFGHHQRFLQRCARFISTHTGKWFKRA